MTLRQQIGKIKYDFFHKLDSALPEDFDVRRFCFDKDYRIGAEAESLVNELKKFDFDFNTDWFNEYIAGQRGLK